MRENEKEPREVEGGEGKGDFKRVRWIRQIPLKWGHHARILGWLRAWIFHADIFNPFTADPVKALHLVIRV